VGDRPEVSFAREVTRFALQAVAFAPQGHASPFEGSGFALQGNALAFQGKGFAFEGNALERQRGVRKPGSNPRGYETDEIDAPRPLFCCGR
jgi:hypothetical protein